MSSRKFIGTIVLGSVLALGAVAQQPQGPVEGPKRHFCMRFEEVQRRAQENLRMDQERLRAVELSEDERSVLTSIVEKRQEIVSNATSALESLEGKDPEELKEIERSIHLDELSMGVLFVRMNKQGTIRRLDQIEDVRARRRLIRKTETVFNQMIEIAEKRIELEQQLWPLEDQREAMIREQRPATQ